MQAKGVKGLVLVALERRPRRATWIYGAVLALYVVYALSAVAELSKMTRWPLVLPALVILVQVFFPTFLGWALVLTGCGGMLLVGCYYLVANALERPPQWSNDLEGYAMGTVIVLILLLVVVVLIRFRPRVTDRLERASPS